MSTTASQLSHATRLATVKLRAAARTDVGRRRTENQDSYGYVHTPRASLYLVADGMGGARGGGTASSMAVNIIADGAVTPEGAITLESLEHAISLSNRVIFTRSQSDPQLNGMGTTVVAVAFVDGAVIVAHVGDSRIYLWRDNNLLQLTRDHTLVQELVDTGAIPQQDAANHPIAHMLTRSLGPTENIGVEIHLLPEPGRPGDKYLMCSDGLYNHVSNEEIGRVLGTKGPVEAADELIQLALDGGGSDNVTLEIVEVLSLSDETVSVERPEDGAVKKFISAEIDTHQFDGTTLVDFTRNLQDKLQKEPQSLPEDAAQPASTNGKARLTAQGASEPATEGQTMVLSGGVKEYLDSIAEPQRTAPARLALIGALSVFAGFVAYWFFFIPVSSSHVAPEQPQQVASATSAASSESSRPEDLTKEMIEYNPAESSASQASSQLAPAESSSAIAAVESSSLPSVPSSAVAESSLPTLPPVEPAKIGTTTVEITPPAPVEPSQAEILTDSEKKYAELLAAARDIRVPPTPRVSLGGGTKPAPADQPIVWERESKAVEQILSNNDAAEPANAAKLRTTEESVQLCDKKEEVRERISDIDTKLELLVLESKEQAKNKQTRIEMEISRLAEARGALEEDLRSAQEDLETWDGLLKKAAATELLKLADDVAALSDDVKQRRAQYSDATEQYFAATDKWQANAKDTEAASTMIALGRDIKAKRVELESAVSAALNKGQIVGQRRTQLLRYDLGNLKRRQDQLNRQVGLLRAFAPDPLPRKKDIQKKLLEERAGLLKNFQDLVTQLPDEEETNFRFTNSELFYSPPA